MEDHKTPEYAAVLRHCRRLDAVMRSSPESRFWKWETAHRVYRAGWNARPHIAEGNTWAEVLAQLEQIK